VYFTLKNLITASASAICRRPDLGARQNPDPELIKDKRSFHRIKGLKQNSSKESGSQRAKSTRKLNGTDGLSGYHILYAIF
jgi:hypothetical protein